jgi:hypothetical protein
MGAYPNRLGGYAKIRQRRLLSGELSCFIKQGYPLIYPRGSHAISYIRILVLKGRLRQGFITYEEAIYIAPSHITIYG